MTRVWAGAWALPLRTGVSVSTRVTTQGQRGVSRASAMQGVRSGMALWVLRGVLSLGAVTRDAGRNAHICGRLVFKKGTENIWQKEELLQQRVSGELDVHMQKNEAGRVISHHVQRLTKNGSKPEQKS